MESEHPALALWRTVQLVDKSKINDWWMALRNALAVAIPLAVGIEMGNSLAAVALAIGALNVSYSDGIDPYFQRGKRMLLWSFLSGVGVFFGTLTGAYHWGATLSAAAWAFAAGMMMGMGSRAGDLGLNTLVTVIVFAARGATTPIGALYSGLLVTAGGCIQTFFALLFWPLHRSKPQMNAIGKVFKHLALEVDPDAESIPLVGIHVPSSQVEETLTALGSDYSLEGERLRLLYDQADRLRLSIYLLKRLRDELGEDDSQRTEVEGDAAAQLDVFLKGASTLISKVGDLLITEEPAADFDQLRRDLRTLVDKAHERKSDVNLKSGSRIAEAMDVVVGQLRLVSQLANNTTAKGGQAFLKSEEAKSWKLQPTNWRQDIAANFTWKSPVFRHAVRLCICIAVADVIQRSIGWQRAYWIPMTAAVVLKPDFTSTFSRGALRLAGTVAGLILATLIYHALPQGGWSQLLMVGVFAFFLRFLGPANYGVFTIAISGLIVFLLAATGVSPAEVVITRAVNTVAGGLLALLAYTVWPTWESATISDSLASMIDAMRLYFRAVSDEFSGVRGSVDERRTHWRLKKTAVEAAVDRVVSEPGNRKARTNCLYSILASSHAIVDAVMGLEAGLLRSAPKSSPPALKTFATDVDLTLYHLENALRGSEFANRTLPELRQDHRKLLEAQDGLSSVDEYVLIETDRLTVSLNTLREQVTRYIAGR